MSYVLGFSLGIPRGSTSTTTLGKEETQWPTVKGVHPDKEDFNKEMLLRGNLSVDEEGIYRRARGNLRVTQ